MTGAVVAEKSRRAQAIINEGIENGRFVRSTEYMADRPIRLALLPWPDEKPRRM